MGGKYRRKRGWTMASPVGNHLPHPVLAESASMASFLSALPSLLFAFSVHKQLSESTAHLQENGRTGSGGGLQCRFTTRATQARNAAARRSQRVAIALLMLSVVRSTAPGFKRQTTQYCITRSENCSQGKKHLATSSAKQLTFSSFTPMDPSTPI